MVAFWSHFCSNSAPKWSHGMGVNLSIKNVPEETVTRLKLRAKRNHRSLQGELRALLDDATGVASAERAEVTITDVIEHGRRLGLKTGSDSTRWIREDRDRR